MQVDILLPYNNTYNITTLEGGGSRKNSLNSTLDMNPPIYIYVYVSAINLIVFFVGVLGNTLVIQVVARVRTMRKRMNYYLVSLSVADLLVLLVGLPAALHEFYGKEKWLLGEAMCKVVPFLENASHHCSVLTLLAIGFERYYAICHPLRKTMGSRVASATILIPAVWATSCLVSVPFAIISNIEVRRYFDDSLVDVCQTNMKPKLARIYSIIIATAFLALPLLLLTVLYSAIIRTLRFSTASTPEAKGSNNGDFGHQGLHQSTRNERALASRRQVIRMMVGVMFLYFLCLIPLRCVQLWSVFGTEKELVELGFEGHLNLMNCVRILVYANSAGNPIIYGLLSSNFRSAFKQSFSRSGRQTSRYNSSHPQLSLRQQPVSTTLETTQIGRQASVTTGMQRKGKRHNDALNSSPKMATSRFRKRCNSDCSENSVDIAIAPLLGQTTSGNMNTEVITSGYQQVKSGLTYV